MNLGVSFSSLKVNEPKQRACEMEMVRDKSGSINIQLLLF